VEDAVAQLPFRHRCAILIQALLGAAQQMKGRDELRFPFLAASLDRLAQRLGLEQDPRAGDVLEVGQGHRRDAKPPLPLHQHEGIGDQAQQGFAQGARAHAVAVLEMFDAQLLARSEDALDDVVAQALIGRFDEGGRFRGRRYGSVVHGNEGKSRVAL